MLEKAEYIELHSDFYDIISSGPWPTDRYIPYEEYRISGRLAQGPEWLLFCSQANDFVREILNGINRFLTYLFRLEAWSTVLNDCPKENRFNIVIEIIEPLASYVLNYIYAIKGRTAFVSISLLHQTFRLLNPEWTESDFRQGRFYFTNVYGFLNRYKDYTGSSEKPDNLRTYLDEIDDSKFGEITREFRGRFQHMIPPNIEIGMSGLINRIESTNGNVSYGIGGQKPLSLKEILPALHSQHEKCARAFETFWELMQELLDIWKRERPSSGSS